MAGSNTMKYTTTFRSAILFLFWLWLPGQLHAQNISVSASLDSTLMVIGGQMNLTLEVVQPKNLEVAFPLFTDTITTNIEIVEDLKTDTTLLDSENDRITLKKIYIITSFDSGLHYIPPIQFEYMEGETINRASTQSLALMVVNPFENVNPEKGIYDIKEPYNLPFLISELYKYIKWFLLYVLLQVVIILIVHYFINNKKPIKEIFIKEVPKEPAHIIALRELDKIKQEKIWQSGQVKIFYSQLTDALRRYIENRYDFQAMEKTSAEIMHSIKEIEFPNKELYDKLYKILNTSDLAKFAKYEPLSDENDIALKNAYYFVNQTKEEPLENPENTNKDNLTKENTESNTIN